MEEFARSLYFAAFAIIALAEVAFAVRIAANRRAAAADDSSVADAQSVWTVVAAAVLSVGFAALTASIIARGLAAGRGPFANQYEFAIAFAWGVTAAVLVAGWRGRQSRIPAVVLPIALGLLAYAAAVPSKIAPLPAALGNSVLLTVHVAVAILAYGTFAIAFGSAILLLRELSRHSRDTDDARQLDAIGYRAVSVGFPLMSLVIMLGAYWARIAWGRYWSWDPKETAALVTWLIYLAYLHTRTIGWRGRKPALLLIAGFAATLLTFLGNAFFGGLHAYGGLG